MLWTYKIGFFMSPTDIATILASYTAVAVVLGGVLWKLFKIALRVAMEETNKKIHEDMDEPINELRHNGGSSLIDVVKLQILPTVLELRENQKIIADRVARLEGRFEQHVDEDPEW